MDDDLHADFVEYLKSAKLPSSFSSSKTNFIRDAKKYSLKDGCLMREGKVVVRESERESLWEAYHCGPQHAGHYGTTFVSRSFYHPG